MLQVIRRKDSDMAKIEEYDVTDVDILCKLGKALSSSIRIEMIRILSRETLNIGEIAKKTGIPASSAAFHLKMLEEAGLVRMEEQPGTRGNMKLCTTKLDRVSVKMFESTTDVSEVFTVELPVGAYSECCVTTTCGLGDRDGVIMNEDNLSEMYMPERLQANILWGSSGYVEYRFPNGVPAKREPHKISISMEICSEAPGHRDDWESDITLWINDVDCGTWNSPGDFGDRRGRLTPQKWPKGASQYGRQVIWEVGSDGSYINGVRIGEADIEQLGIMDNTFIAVRVGNKEDAVHVGGFNIYGKHFGDYNQDIVLTIEY